jgi:hypothetical protein
MMLRRNMPFPQSGEKLPNHPDNQIVQCNNFNAPLEIGE